MKVDSNGNKYFMIQLDKTKPTESEINHKFFPGNFFLVHLRKFDGPVKHVFYKNQGHLIYTALTVLNSGELNMNQNTLFLKLKFAFIRRMYKSGKTGK